MLREILRGGGDAVAEAGASVVGGHSIDDPEPKYGLAVTGLVAPGRGAHQRGRARRRRLVLTKPLGGRHDRDRAQARARWRWSSWRAASTVMTTSTPAPPRRPRGGAHALTDVTGFGLLGHVHELADGFSGFAADDRR